MVWDDLNKGEKILLVSKIKKGVTELSHHKQLEVVELTTSTLTEMGKTLDEVGGYILQESNSEKLAELIEGREKILERMGVLRDLRAAAF